MGLLKRLAMQQEEQGWSFTDSDVCVECVDDYALEAIIQDSEQADASCAFCGHIGAAPLDALIEAFVNGLSIEYGDPDNEGVYWDGREGGYQWDTKDTWDLIEEYSHVLIGDGLQDALRDSIENRLWVERDFIFRRRDQVLLDSWERFCETVKHHTRYVLWLKPHEDHEDEQYGEVPAGRILGKIGEFIKHIDLIEEIPARTRIWRARAHDQPIEASAKTVGTTPREHATRANRMNPAGIPMFYGSPDRDHAIREVLAIEPHRYVTCAQFETTQPCYVVNFAKLPDIPSVFDPQRGPDWRQFHFLHLFTKQLSLPTEPVREQIDYVPTQILTEYLVNVLDMRVPIAGLSFNSALGHVDNIVLNVTNERCLDTETDDGAEHLRLKIVPNTIETRDTQTSPPD